MTRPNVRWDAGGEMIALTVTMIRHRWLEIPGKDTLDENRLWWARHTTIDAQTEQSDMIR